MYLAHRDNSKPAPSYRSPRKTGEAYPLQQRRDGEPAMRDYVRVDAETQWDLMEEAHRSGTHVSQVVKVRRADRQAGCSASISYVWHQRRNAMYRERRQLSFLGSDHLNIVADPANHSKKDTMASIIWSWQAGLAAYGDLQYIPHGGLLPSEQEMPEHIAELYSERRLERLSAFRQLQALSNTIKNIGGWSGLDDFALSRDHHVDAVVAGEQRVLAPAQDDDYVRAVIVQKETGVVRRVLPDAAFMPSQSYKLLTLNLDQGGVGYVGNAGSLLSILR